MPNVGHAKCLLLLSSSSAQGHRSCPPGSPSAAAPLVPSDPSRRTRSPGHTDPARRHRSLAHPQWPPLPAAAWAARTLDVNSPVTPMPCLGRGSWSERRHPTLTAALHPASRARTPARQSRSSRPPPPAPSPTAFGRPAKAAAAAAAAAPAATATTAPTPAAPPPASRLPPPGAQPIGPPPGGRGRTRAAGGGGLWFTRPGFRRSAAPWPAGGPERCRTC